MIWCRKPASLPELSRASSVETQWMLKPMVDVFSCLFRPANQENSTFDLFHVQLQKENNKQMY